MGQDGIHSFILKKGEKGEEKNDLRPFSERERIESTGYERRSSFEHEVGIIPLFQSSMLWIVQAFSPPFEHQFPRVSGCWGKSIYTLKTVRAN